MSASALHPIDRHRVYWPRGQRTVAQQPLAPRLTGFEGKTVAFLWDYLFRGDEFFPMIEAELKRRFEGLRVISYETFGSTHAFWYAAGMLLLGTLLVVGLLNIKHRELATEEAAVHVG